MRLYNKKKKKITHVEVETWINMKSTFTTRPNYSCAYPVPMSEKLRIVEKNKLFLSFSWSICNIGKLYIQYKAYYVGHLNAVQIKIQFII